MDYRPFERANELCKPKHFGPPTALQLLLAYQAAYHLSSPENTTWQRLIKWLKQAFKRN